MLLYITRKFPPSIGGMQRFNEKLYNNLKDQTPIQLIKWGGSQIFLPFFLIYALCYSLIICLTKKINVIYVSDGLLSTLGYALKIITRKPVVVTIHGRDIAFQFPGYQTIIPWCLRRMNHIICVSQDLKNECLKRNVSESKLSVIPNGVDIEDFELDVNINARNEFKKLFQIDLVNKKVILTVGRLVPKKGIDRFIKEIMPELVKNDADIIYIIAGDGPLRNQIETLIAKNNLSKNVFLIGNVPMESGDLNIVYHAADVFVMPNIEVANDREGFGIVAIEAGAAGLPVIASKVDGITEAVQDGENGVLIDSKTYSSFTRIIFEFLEIPHLRTQLTTKSKQYIEQNFNWEIISFNYKMSLIK